MQAAIFSVMDFSPFAYAYRASKSEFFVMVCTFLVTLGLGIDKGILAGVALSIVALIRRASHPRLKVLGIVRGPRHVTFRDVTRYPAALMPAPGVCIIRIDESVNFASCASVKDQLLHIAHDPAYVRRHHVVGDRDHNGGGNGNDNGAGGGAHGSSSNGNGGGAPPPPPAATNCLASAGSPIATLMRGVRLPGGGARSQSEEPHHHPRPEKVVVDFSSVNNVDLSGIKALDEVQATLAREKQAMYVCNVKVRERLENLWLNDGWMDGRADD